MLNAQATNKAAEKGGPDTNQVKSGADLEKVVNQLKQDIRTLTKAVKEIQQKIETQGGIITIPRKLLSKVKAYLSDCEQSAGVTMNLSELICGALEIYLWGEEENKCLEKEREGLS